MTRDFVHSHISRGVATVAGGNRAKSQDSLCVFVGAQLNEQLLYLVRDPGLAHRNSACKMFSNTLKYVAARPLSSDVHLSL